MTTEEYLQLAEQFKDMSSFEIAFKLIDLVADTRTTAIEEFAATLKVAGVQ